MLTVEDGSGATSPPADAFVSLAEADAYFAAYGGVWTGTDADKEAAIRRATAWLSTYIRWHGQRTHGRAQPLAWPRTGVTDCEGEAIPDDVVPAEVKTASLIASSFELQTPGALTPAITPSEVIKRARVDVIEAEYRDPEYKGRDRIDNARPALAAVQDVLRCLANVSGLRIPHPVVV